MPRWEYCNIYMVNQTNPEYPVGYSQLGLFYYKTGQTVSIDKNDPVGIFKAITKLGNEGWELVTVTQQSGAHGYVATTYYFKRPL